MTEGEGAECSYRQGGVRRNRRCRERRPLPQRRAVQVLGESFLEIGKVPAAMLFQAGSRTNAPRALLKSEQERSSDFLRLANALSALYPKGSEEKRLVDAMLLAVPR